MPGVAVVAAMPDIAMADRPPAAGGLLGHDEDDESGGEEVPSADGDDEARRTCGGGRWRAANPGKGSLPDKGIHASRGVVFAVCRHYMLISAVMMRKGEEYGLHLLVLLACLAKFGLVAYHAIDVACMFRPFARKNFERVCGHYQQPRFAVGELHSRLHAFWCRVRNMCLCSDALMRVCACERVCVYN